MNDKCGIQTSDGDGLKMVTLLPSIIMALSKGKCDSGSGCLWCAINELKPDEELSFVGVECDVGEDGEHNADEQPERDKNKNTSLEWHLLTCG